MVEVHLTRMKRPSTIYAGCVFQLDDQAPPIVNYFWRLPSAQSVTADAHNIALGDLIQNAGPGYGSLVQEVADLCGFPSRVSMIEVHDIGGIRSPAVHTWHPLDSINPAMSFDLSPAMYLHIQLPVSVSIGFPVCGIFFGILAVVFTAVNALALRALCMPFPKSAGFPAL